jgi:hypothetical protein
MPDSRIGGGESLANIQSIDLPREGIDVVDTRLRLRRRGKCLNLIYLRGICLQIHSAVARHNNRVRDRHHRRSGVRGNLVHGGHRRLHRQRVDEHHQPCVEHQRLADDIGRGWIAGSAGGVTVEAAFAIAALVVVLALCVSGLTAVSMQVRCVDAAREAARLAARGDDGSAAPAAQGIAPDGAAVRLRREGELVVATVTARSPLLPGITIAAEATAAAEPGPR